MNVKPRPQRGMFFDSRIELKVAFPKLQNVIRDTMNRRRKNRSLEENSIDRVCTRVEAFNCVV